MRRVCKALPLVLLILAFSAAARTNPAYWGSLAVPVQSPEVKTATGELTSVDVDNHTFTIKDSDEEMVFQYDENTKVEGRENGVQGLSTETGIQLTVHYTEEDGKRVVTKIEIKKSEG